MTTLDGSPRSRWSLVPTRRSAAAAACAGIYAFAGLAAIATAWCTDGAAWIWPANAVGAALILRNPRERTPLLIVAILVVAAAFAAMPGLAPAVPAVRLVATAVEVVVAAEVLRWLLSARNAGEVQVPGVLAICIATAGVGPAAGAALAGLLTGDGANAFSLAVFAAWWKASAAGAIIVAPLLAVPHAAPSDADRRSMAETLAIVVAVLASGVGAVARFGFPFILIILPLMLAATRLAPLWMAALCSSTAAFLIVGEALGYVPELTGHPAEIHVATAITVILPYCACLLLTRMRQDRRALLATNVQLRRTFDESAIGVAIATCDGTIVRANPAYCKMFGRSVADLVGVDYHTLTHPDDVALDDAIVAATLRAGRSVFEFEKRYIRPDGSPFWTRLHGTILRDEVTGNPVYFVSQVFDIDERKRVEQELAAVRDRWDFALESAGQGVWDIDLVSGVVHCSSTWTAILGRDLTDVTAMVKSWRDHVHPDDLAAAVGAVDDHIAGRSEVYEATFRLPHRDGRWIWVLSRGRVVERGADGTARRIIGTITDISRQKENEEKLATLNERIRLAAQAGGVGMWSWNQATRELNWDERMFALYGIDPAAATGNDTDWSERLHPEDRESAEETFRRAIDGGIAYNTVFRVVWPNGEIRHIRALGHRRIDADGSVVMLGTNWDVTEQRLVSEALAAEKERLRVTLHSIGDAVICTDTQGRITFMNLAAETLTGWIEPLVKGDPLDTIYRPVHEDTGEGLPSSVAEALQAGVAVEQQHPGKLVRADGSVRSIRDTAAPVRAASGEVIGAVLVFQDVTTARALQRDLAFAASHDALTSLKNRAAFEGALQAAHADARASREPHAVLFIDLDRFKVLNDTAGHAAGDALLREVAAVIRSAVRVKDVVARLGGDEFAVLLDRCPIDDAERIGLKIIDAVKAVRFAWNGKVYSVGASIGITALSADSSSTADVVAQADVACYAAKAGGRDRVSVYRPDSSEAHRHLSDLHIAAGIRESIEADRFRLYAQEIRDLDAPLARGRKIEVLTRMVGPDGAMIPPGVFIPAAERFDLMSALDQWVLRTTLRTYGEQIQSVPDLTVAVNLSANSLNDAALWDFLSGELAATGFDPNRLMLEITETAVINNFGAAERFVEAARRAGCRVSLDDFGSGVSSFSYLKRFAVDTIKIDGTFVRNMKTNRYDRTIVRLIHEVGAELGVDTIAEYVEDVETVELLREIGVRYGQGYLFHRPRPIAEVLAEHGAVEPLRRLAAAG